MGLTPYEAATIIQQCWKKSRRRGMFKQSTEDALDEHERRKELKTLAEQVCSNTANSADTCFWERERGS